MTIRLVLFLGSRRVARHRGVRPIDDEASRDLPMPSSRRRAANRETALPGVPQNPVGDVDQLYDAGHQQVARQHMLRALDLARADHGKATPSPDRSM